MRELAKCANPAKCAKLPADQANGDYVVEVLRPVMDEVRQALQSIMQPGYGSITLRIEDGQIKQVIFQVSLKAVDRIHD